MVFICLYTSSVPIYGTLYEAVYIFVCFFEELILPYNKSFFAKAEPLFP